jgi:hypothetical protein
MKTHHKVGWRKKYDDVNYNILGTKWNDWC